MHEYLAPASQERQATRRREEGVEDKNTLSSSGIEREDTQPHVDEFFTSTLPSLIPPQVPFDLPRVLKENDDFGESLRRRLSLCSRDAQGPWMEEVLASGFALMNKEQDESPSDEHKYLEEVSISSSCTTSLREKSSTALPASYRPIQSKMSHDSDENDDLSDSTTMSLSSYIPSEHPHSMDSMRSETLIPQTPDRDVSAGLGWSLFSEGEKLWIDSEQGLVGEGGEIVSMNLTIGPGLRQRNLPEFIEKVLAAGLVDSQ